ncbi:hypothetical protein JTB14_003327 [Gonioctena quinquepunctata]|nr:hypothetical protein JTB14_003327 [Gonioctena quinquepunctata]
MEKVEYVEDGVNEGYGEWSPEDCSSWDNQNIYPFAQYWTNAQPFRNTIHPDSGNQFENLGNDCFYGIASKPETGGNIEQRCNPHQEQFFEECQKHVTKVARENKGHRFRTCTLLNRY